MDINLVTEGLKFMVLGMVTVYLFLILMILILNIQSKIVHKFFPNEKLKVINAATPENKSTSNGNEVLVAVITGAIQQYKNKKHNN